MPTSPGVDGTPLHHDEVGDAAAPPVIVLAGGAARHPEYLGDLAGLGDRWRLVLPHLRGVGRSPVPEEVEHGSFWRQAADIDRLREHLGLDRCILAGHSAGTRLAISYAAQFPDRLAGLLLITPPATYLVDVPTDSASLILDRRGEPVFDTAWAALQTGPDVSSDASFNAWQQSVAPTGYAVWGERERAHAASGTYHLGAAKAFFSMEPPADFPQRLRAVTAPAMVIAGARDIVTGVAPVLALADLFPEGRAVVVDRCGHFPWVEQPVAFRQAVDPFLDEVGSFG